MLAMWMPAKRALIMADHIARDLCAHVAHRQFVFTIPKRLRVFFRFDRRLLGALPRLAWQTVLEVYRVVLDRRDVTPASWFTFTPTCTRW